MIEYTQTAPATRPCHALTAAKRKLGLKLPQDRSAAAGLLLQARRINRACEWRKATWARHLDVAASFALQEAEAADCDSAYRLFDHIAHVMESTAGFNDLRAH